METIKVIHCITRLILGGAQQNTMETCQHLNKKRFKTSIISGNQTGPEGEIIPEVRGKKIPLIIIPELLREPNPVKDIIALKKMVRIFKQQRPHIVHTHSSKAGILGRWAAKIAGVPIIIHTVHGWGHHGHQHPLKRAFFIFLERKSERITDKLIVVSSLNAEKGLKDRIGKRNKYKTIHSSINLATYQESTCDIPGLKKQLGLSTERPVVGTVARFSSQKNPGDFVRVAALVKEKMPGVQFMFVGDGPLRKETEEMIKKFNLSQDVILPGLRTDIPDILKCMDVFILTSLWEGLPRVIAQAMASGVPVIANDVDGAREVINHGRNGFLTAPKDVSLMTDLVVKLLQDPDLCGKISEEGKITAQSEFSLTDMISEIERLYESLLAEKSVLTN